MKVGNTGPLSRNTNSDVFNYKGRTVNIVEIPTVTLPGNSRNAEPSLNKNQLSTLLDGMSERNSQKDRNRTKDSKPISKSQS